MHDDGAFGDELPAGSSLCGGQYVIERYLNSGGFGITYLARDSLNRRVVLKECFPGAMCCRTAGTVRLRSRNSDDEFATILELFEKEARALSELTHPYIVGVHQIFQDNGTAYMALDFIEGQDLLQIIEHEPGRLGPEEVKALLIKLLEAVQYIHQHDILHRDISPDNILLDAQNQPVMIDFGAARESATRVSRVLSKVLTVKDGYSPQEFYLAGSKQEYSSDLYALAATFYHLIKGEAPPSSHLRMAAVARGAADPIEPLQASPGYEQEFVDAINRCLSVFPNDRLPSAEAWRDAIDLERRRQLLLEQAQDDKELELRVLATVQEYQRQVAEDPTAAPPPPKPAGAARPAAPKPKPKRKLEYIEPAHVPEVATDGVVDPTGPLDMTNPIAAIQAREEARARIPKVKRIVPQINPPEGDILAGDPVGDPEPRGRRTRGGAGHGTLGRFLTGTRQLFRGRRGESRQ